MTTFELIFKLIIIGIAFVIILNLFNKIMDCEDSIDDIKERLSKLEKKETTQHEDSN